jgi:hypothetical protein
MRVPLYLEIAQWALLLGLAGLVIVMYRQLARLLGHRDDTHEMGPRVGSSAAAFRYAPIPGDTASQLVPGDGQALLIAFVDPTCPACEQLVTSLGELQGTGQLAGARVLLLVSDPPGYLRISPAFQATSLEIGRPLSPAEVAGYRATGTPLLVAVDAGGVVRAAGVASRPAEVLAFAGALDFAGAPTSAGALASAVLARTDRAGITPEQADRPSAADLVMEGEGGT